MSDQKQGSQGSEKQDPTHTPGKAEGDEKTVDKALENQDQKKSK
jgi:hypothetical protein